MSGLRSSRPLILSCPLGVLFYQEAWTGANTSFPSAPNSLVLFHRAGEAELEGVTDGIEEPPNRSLLPKLWESVGRVGNEPQWNPMSVGSATGSNL